jgi:hypothetical protein
MQTTIGGRASAGSGLDLKITWRGRQIVRPVPIQDEESSTFIRWLDVLNDAHIPYAVGGAYALYAYTGNWRNSKDLDVFLQPCHLKPALDAMIGAGFRTEVRDRQWLAKVHHPPYLLDLLFAIRHSSVVKINGHWFEACRRAEFLGIPVCFLAPEELLASKVYLAARDRFDGADIAHLIRATQGEIEWERVLDLLAGDDLILFWHLVLFQFVYPGHVEYLPTGLMERAFERLRDDWGVARDPRSFRGMILDAKAFATDHELWGYEDIRDKWPLVGHEGESLHEGEPQ